MRVTLSKIVQHVLPRPRAARALALSEWQTLVQVAEVLVAGGPHGSSVEQIADNVDAFLVAGRSRRAWRVRVLLTVIRFSTVPSHRRSFDRLSIAERRAWILARWTPDHRIGRLCSKVKNLVVLGAYGDARAAAKTGYVPVQDRIRFVRTA
jgi:hypothetical protein